MPKEDISDLKRALRRYAKERRGVKKPTKELCLECGAKKRKYDA